MGIKMDEYELLDKDTGPYGITAGKDGALWFTQHKANQIGRLTMQGEITEFPIPTQNRSRMELQQVLMVPFGSLRNAIRSDG
ncbi:hypothetical protein IFR10_11080 [Bacillus sp. CFBP 13597]|uniref:virginiamycin B lyase family protein n=1 Tax=Peribacillus frigoritolerans TaxID=450367 RepID=UPI001596711C|nr:hypothetical protein [Bacillus sp. CFBP 13597]